MSLAERSVWRGDSERDRAGWESLSEGAHLREAMHMGGLDSLVTLGGFWLEEKQPIMPRGALWHCVLI